MRLNTACSQESGEGQRLPFSEGICPLCSEVFAIKRLHGHIEADNPRSRARTVEVIKAYHRGWLEENGACETCWESYKSASGILSKLKSNT